MTKEPSMRGTGNRVWPAATLIAVLGIPGVAAAASTITGTVTFAGTPPTLRPIAMDAEPVCAKKHTGGVLGLGTRGGYDETLEGEALRAAIVKFVNNIVTQVE